MKDGKAQRGGEEDTFQQLPIDEDVFELKASLAAKRTLTNSHDRGEPSALRVP